MTSITRKRPVLPTLLSRGGLVCLLFLLPWFPNLHAQSNLGQVGIGDPPGNEADLIIEDDDNINSSGTSGGPESLDRRTIVISPTITSITEGENLTFKLKYKDDRTTAIKDVWVKCQLLVGGTNGTATLVGTNIDFTRPDKNDGSVVDYNKEGTQDETFFWVKIPAGNNISELVEIPTKQDLILEGDETFTLKMIEAKTIGEFIPSRENSSEATIFPVAVDNQTFTIKDEQAGAKVVLVYTTTTLERSNSGSHADSQVTISAKLMDGANEITAGKDIAITLPFTQGTAINNADYTVTPSDGKIIIAAGDENSNGISGQNIIVKAKCNDVFDADRTITLLAQNMIVVNGMTNAITTVDDASKKNITIKKTDIGNTITSTPANTHAICKDGIVELAAPTGTGTLTYRWYYKQGATTSIDLGTASTYEVKGADLAAGDYEFYVEVANSYGCNRVSDKFDVKVYDEVGVPTITSTTPVGTYCSPLTVMLTRSNSINAISYEWYRVKDGGTAELLTVAEVNNSVTVTENASGVYKYYVVAKSATCSSGISNALEYTVSGTGTSLVKPGIKTIGGSDSPAIICGTDGSLTLAATTYTDNVTYFWSYKLSESDITATTVNPTGSGSHTLNISDGFTGDRYYYVRVEYNDGGCNNVSAISNAFKVTKNSGATAVVQPQIAARNTSSCASGSTIIDITNVVAASYTFPPHAVRWYKAVSNTAEGVLTGDVSTSIAVENTTTETWYYAIVSNGDCESKQSTRVSVKASGTTNELPSVKLASTAGNEVCVAGSVHLAVQNHEAIKAKDNNVTYSWFCDNPSIQLTFLNGKTDHIIEVPYDKANNITYWVVAVGDCVSEASNRETLNQSAHQAPGAPSITPAANVACEGGTVAISVTNVVANLKYYWFKEGEGQILVNNDPNTPYEGVSYSAAPGTYYAVAIDGNTCESLKSNSVTINPSGSTNDLVTPALKAENNGEVCSGNGSVKLYVENTTDYTGKNISYYWFRQNKAGSAPTYTWKITASNQPTINVDAADADHYRVVVVENGGCSSQSSGWVEVKVTGNTTLDKAKIVIAQGNAEVCGNGSVMLHAVKDPSGTSFAGVTYKWYRSDKYPEVLGTGEFFEVKFTDDDAVGNHYYSVDVLQGGCKVASEIVVKKNATTATATPIIIAKPANGTGSGECTSVTGSVLLTAKVNETTSYPAAVTFDWWRAKDAARTAEVEKIPSATSAILNVSDEGTWFYFVFANDGSCTSTSSENSKVVISATASSLNTPILDGNAITVCGTENGSATAKLAITNPTDFANNVAIEWYHNLDGLVTSSHVASGTSTTGAVIYVTKAGTYRARAVTNCETSVLSVNAITVTFNGTNTVPQLAFIDGCVERIIQGVTGSRTIAISNHTDYPAGTKVKWYVVKGGSNIELSGGDLTQQVSYTVEGSDATIFTTAATQESVIIFAEVTIPSGQACGSTSVTSCDVTVTLKRDGVAIPTPIITADPDPATVCAGSDITLMANAPQGESYNNPRYQWSADGSPLAGKTDKDIVVTVTTTEVKYRVTVTTDDGEATSIAFSVVTANSGNISVLKPVIVAEPAAGNDCNAFTSPRRIYVDNTAGIINDLTTNGSAIGTPQVTFRWFKNGVLQHHDVNGTTAVYEADFFMAVPPVGSGQDEYKAVAVVKNPTCGSIALSDQSNSVNITAVSNAAAVIVPVLGGDDTFCQGGTGKIEVTNLAAIKTWMSDNSISDYWFTWYNEQGLYVNKTKGSSIDVGDELKYSVQLIVSTDGTCEDKSSLSNWKNLTEGSGQIALNKPMVVVDESSSSELCSTTSKVILRAVKDDGSHTKYPNDGSVVFTWSYMGVKIPGATTQLYEVPYGKSGLYTVTVSVAGSGCEVGNTQDKGYVVNQTGTPANTPEIPAITKLDGENVCGDNGYVTLQATPKDLTKSYPAGTKYTWVRKYTQNGVEVSQTFGPYDITNTLKVTKDMLGDYGVIVSHTGCTSTSEDLVNVDQVGTGNLPATEIVIDGTPEVCAVNGSVQLVANILGGVTPNATTRYTWWECDEHGNTIGNAPVQAKGTNNTYLAKHAATDTYYKVVILHDGCSLPVAVSAKIISSNGTAIEKPIVALDARNEGVCGANGNVILRVTNHTPGTTYYWYWSKNENDESNRKLLTSTNSEVLIGKETEDGYYMAAIKRNIAGCGSEVGNELKVTIDPSGTPAETPVIIQSGKACGVGSAVVLKIQNVEKYGANAQFLWMEYNGNTYRVLNAGTPSQNWVSVTGTGTVKYGVIITVDKCNTNEGTANVIFGSDPAIDAPTYTIDPASGKVCGADGTAKVTITNAVNFKELIWSKENGTTVTIPASANVYSVSPGTYVVVGVAANNCVSQPVSITITFDGTKDAPQQPVLNKLVDGDMICAGNGSVMLVVANSTDYKSSATYEWYNIAKPSTSTVSYPVVTTEPKYAAVEKGLYYVRVLPKDGTACADSGSANSNIEEVDAITTPSFTFPERPELALVNNVSICGAEGTGSATIEVTNHSVFVVNNPQYRWTRTWKDASGSHNMYTYPLSTEPRLITTLGGVYNVQVIVNGCASKESDNSITVTVGTNGTGAVDKPILSPSTAQAVTICKGGSETISIANKHIIKPGTNYEYRWYKVGGDGTPTGDVRGPEYIAVEAGRYYLIVTDMDEKCSSLPSDTLEVRVSANQASKVRIDGPTEYCQGGSVTLTAVVENPSIDSNDKTIRYDWYLNGQPYDMNKIDNSVLANKSGNYRVVVRSISGSICTTSSPANAQHELNESGTGIVEQPIISGSNQVCIGGSTVLTISNASNFTNAMFVWYVAPLADRTNFKKCESTTNGTSYSKLTVIEEGVYAVVVVEGGCQTNLETSTQHEVRFTSSNAPQAPTIKTDAEDVTACENIGVQLYAVLNGGITDIDVASYIWYKDGRVLDGKNEPTLNVNEAGLYKVAIVLSGSGCTSVPSSNDIYVNVSNDAACAASRIEFSVEKKEIVEGQSMYVRAELQQGYVAAEDMVIKIDNTIDPAHATRGAVCDNNLGIDYTLASTITILKDSSITNDATSIFTACEDDVYDPREPATLQATYMDIPVGVGSVQDIVIRDKYYQTAYLDFHVKANTTLPGHGDDVVMKGEEATLTVTLYTGSDCITPYPVQRNLDIKFDFIRNTSLELRYTANLDKDKITILAGKYSNSAKIDIHDDNVQTGDLKLNTEVDDVDLQNSLSGVRAAQDLFIKCPHTNDLGGADIEITLAPSAVREGEPFVLLARVISHTIKEADGSPRYVQTSTIKQFDIAEIASTLLNRAIDGRDYTLPKSMTIEAFSGTNRDGSSARVNIETIDNNLFDRDRQMDIKVTPTDGVNIVTSLIVGTNVNVPVLSGIILDDDRPCIEAVASKTMLDDSLDKTSTITLRVNNLTETSGTLTLRFKTEGRAIENKHFELLGFTNVKDKEFVFTHDVTTAELTVNSLLEIPVGVDRSTFKIGTYTPTHEELIISIDRDHIVPATDYDCFNPIQMVISDDYDRDGIPNWVERKDPLCPGDDGLNPRNGQPREWDPYDPNADDDGDGIPNWMEDTDRDGNPYNDFALGYHVSNNVTRLPNFLNTDSDEDGVPDSAEKWTDRPYDDNKDEIRVHPALSLNDDGVGNDYLYIENIEKYENHVKIFDRQGIVIFEMKNYTNDPSTAFRGYPNKGNASKKVPLGTYFYYIEYNDKKTNAKKLHSGYVEIRY